MPKSAVAIAESIAISTFVAQFRFLSNFYPIETGLLYEGIIFQTSEHAYQAAKCSGYDAKLAIAQLSTATEAKHAGGIVQLPDNWDKIKVPIMEAILRSKFSLPYLRDKLIQTGDVALIEGNQWHDNFWGTCYCSKCVTYPGKNILGKLLVKLRTELYLSDDYQRTLQTP